MKKLVYAALGLIAGCMIAESWASRNSSGTYSLPNADVVTGGLISSTWANTTLHDMQTEFTDSLSRSGKGPMLQPLQCVDGTGPAPGLTFGTEAALGLYRKSAGQMCMTAASTDVLCGISTGVTVPGTLGVTGASTLTGAATTVAALNANGGVTTSTANASVTVKGNRSAADVGTDVVLNSTATRSAGFLAAVQNNGTDELKVDTGGVISFYRGAIVLDDAIDRWSAKTDADQVDSVGAAVDITGISFSVIANGIYVFDATGPACMTGSTSTILFGWTGPASPTWVNWAVSSTGTSVFSSANSTRYAFDASFNQAAGMNLCTSGAPSQGNTMRTWGTIVNGANAGTVKLQFQWSGVGTSATVKKGWLLRWRRIA